MRDINGIHNVSAEHKSSAVPSGYKLTIARPSGAADTADGKVRSSIHEAKHRKISFNRILHTGVKHKKLVLLILIAVGCATFGFGMTRAVPKNATVTPLPSDLITALPFPAYYLKAVTSGYNLQPNSANIKTGILFYALQNDKKRIFVTEQQRPSNINLSSLPQHNSINVPIGQAIVGTGLGNPSIVIMAPQTLVELTSNKGVSKTDVISIAQQLAATSQQ